MANVGYATLQIIPSAKGFVPALSSQIAPGMKDAGDVAGKQFSGGLMAQLKSVAGPLAAAVSFAAVTAGVKSVITAASDLRESALMTSDLFHMQADSIVDWAKTAADGFGLSQTAALDAASGFGVFGRSAGLQGPQLATFSTQLTQLGGDMASFWHKPTEDSLGALNSALRGEYEPLRRFGILLDEAKIRQQALSMGIISSTKDALTPNQRVLAVNAVIMRESINQQGDYAKYSDTVANRTLKMTAKFTNMKAALGTVLQPAMKLALAGLTSIFTIISKTPKPVLVFIGVFVAAAAVALTLSKAIAITKAAVTALNIAMKANVIGLVVAVLAALAAAFAYAYTHSEKFRKAVNTGFIAIATVVGQVVGYVIGWMSTLVKVYSTVVIKILSIASHLPIVGKAAGAARDLIQRNADGITDKLDSMAKNAKGSMKKFATALTEKMPKIAGDTSYNSKDDGKGTQGNGGPKVITAAMAAAMKSLSKDLGSAFVKAVQGSEEQIKSAFEKLAADVKTIGNKKLVAAVADTQKKILALATKRDALSEQYKTAKDQLSSLKDEANSYLKSVTDSVVATGNIANGRSFTNMVRSLTQSLTKAKEFNTVIAGLKNAGLNSTSLSQLVEAGPAAGLKAAKALLASGNGGVAIVNDLATQLKAEGAGIGKTITGSIFDAATAEAEGAVKKIGDELTTIENQIVTVAAAFATQVAKIGKIAAPAWLSDLVAVTNYTVPKTVAPTSSPGTKSQTTSSNVVGGNSPQIVVNAYNPIAEPTSVTTARLMTKLALMGGM